MWVNNLVSKPLRKGYYRTLVDGDGFGNLEEVDNELYNGTDWDLYDSNGRFIKFWWAEENDYKTISSKLEEEFNNFLGEDV